MRNNRTGRTACRPLSIRVPAGRPCGRRRKIPPGPGTGRAAGFTLIELLIVVVIITILASLAIFHVYEGKRRAQIAAVRQDLKNLVSAQEAYFTDTQAYAGDLASLTGMFRTSEGVEVAVDSASGTGWGAHGTHEATDGECVVAVSRGSTGIVSCS